MGFSVLILLVVLFALNMGGGNFAASFAAASGGKIISRKWAQILFCIFVFLGAVLGGERVSQTLGAKIIPAEFLKLEVLIIILLSATASLFIANLLDIPQSTSFVTVGAILGAGLYFKNVYSRTFLYLIPFWIILPLAGYALTYLAGRLIYPPRKTNFWIYEKLVNHQQRLRALVIIASCYNAFSVGTNNVANAVGPLAGAGILDNRLGLVLIAPLFGIGSLFFSGPLRTASEKIVPLGLLSATIVCLVTASLMITASLFGVPQSFVMIKVASIFAVSGLKNGHRLTFNNPLSKKTYLSWVIAPLVTIISCYLLLRLRYALFN